MISSILGNWKYMIVHSAWNANNLFIDNDHLMKGLRILTTEKLTSKEVYHIFKVFNKPSSNLYFEELLKDHNRN